MDLVPVEYNPNVLAELIKHFPELAELNAAAAAGLNAAPPTIALNGTRFIKKENGGEETLNVLQLNVAVVAAKESLSKTYYVGKFVPGQEPTSPDCLSSNGITPDAAAKLKQAENCVGCTHNQFGTSTAADGTPGKGKACTDAKNIVVYHNGSPYLFKIPPASLNNFGAYIRSLSGRGIPLPTCVTVIGFDPAFSYPVLTFSFAGMLAPEQIKKVLSVANSPEVLDLIGKRAAMLPVPTAPPVVAPPVVAPPVVAPPVVAPPVVAPPVVAPSVVAPPVVAPPVVAPSVVAPPVVAPPVVAAGAMSDDDIASLLGL